MLVYSMTPEEKVMELKRDYWELMIQIKAWGDAFCKEARKMKNIHWITAFMEKHKVCKIVFVIYNNAFLTSFKTETFA